MGPDIQITQVVARPIRGYRDYVASVGLKTPTRQEKPRKPKALTSGYASRRHICAYPRGYQTTLVRVHTDAGISGIGEDVIDRVVVKRVDVPSRELRGEALAVSIRHKAHDDDDPLDSFELLDPFRSEGPSPESPADDIGDPGLKQGDRVEFALGDDHVAVAEVEDELDTLVVSAIRTPLEGLYLACMSQVYPWDRGTNYAVEIGRRAAQMILEDGGA